MKFSICLRTTAVCSFQRIIFLETLWWGDHIDNNTTDGRCHTTLCNVFWAVLSVKIAALIQTLIKIKYAFENGKEAAEEKRGIGITEHS